MSALPAANNMVLAKWPYFSDDEIAATQQVLASGKINYWTGNECRLFETEFANKIGMQYGIALMNGSVALEAALYALDIGPGDEVITTPRTFMASASSIILRGATPVFADVDPVTQNIAADAVEALITPKTKAIIVVHLAGWPCDMDAFIAIAKKYGLYIIEDCAQAHGAKYRDQYVGSFGDITSFSFCQDKIITTGGEGGMVLTNNERLYKKMWAYKDHGKSYDAVAALKHHTGCEFQWLIASFGTNWRMTEYQAAIGRIQLRKLDNWINTRRRNASILTNRLRDLTAIRITEPEEHIQHAYYKYYAFIRPDKLKNGWSRNKILNTIHAAGVPCFVGSCGEIYREVAFNNHPGKPSSTLPFAKALFDTSMMFLCHPTLSETEMHWMADVIHGVISNATMS